MRRVQGINGIALVRGGPLAWLIAWRYLRGRRSRLLDRTARAALASVALGVTAMVIAMALMSGYRDDLERKLIVGNAAILAFPLQPGAEPAPAPPVEALLAIRGVRTVGQVAYGQGTLSSARRPDGLAVTLRGVDPGGEQLSGSPEELAADGNGIPGVLLGLELARRLEASPGDALRLVALGFSAGAPSFQYASVRLSGTFDTGFAQFDQGWMVLERGVVERLAGGEGSSRLYELSVEDPAAAPQMAEQVREVLGPEFLVTDWQQLNRPLFSALRLQQLALFFLLGLIVVVSTFNVASTLMVLVRERTRDVGVLSALGLSRLGLSGIFVCYGVAVGVVGSLVGVLLGGSVSWILTTFRLIRFDADVAAIYFIDAVPFKVQAGDLIAVVGFALAVTFFSCLFPAWRAARIDPVVALRYE